jgi:Protein of unknown function (DUF2971)
MGPIQLNQLFVPLYDDLRAYGADAASNPPLLAHYTSIPVLEAILRNNELWLSNPLYMNDVEEVRFCITEGVHAFVSSPAIETACETKPRFETQKQQFQLHCLKFDQQRVVDTYVLCLSKHEKEDHDGLLSMWRGYGSNGNGAAIVFDSARVERRERTPFITAKVEYASAEMRRQWISLKIEHFASILKANTFPDHMLYVAAFAFFNRLKLFALFSKHPEFGEEKEWRVVYMPDRGNEGALSKMIDYWIGPRGIEPKLKLKVGPISGSTDANVSLSKIVDRIILGPALSTPLALIGINKMVRSVAPELKARIASSRIPFRPTAHIL